MADTMYKKFNSYKIRNSACPGIDITPKLFISVKSKKLKKCRCLKTLFFYLTAKSSFQPLHFLLTGAFAGTMCRSNSGVMIQRKFYIVYLLIILNKDINNTINDDLPLQTTTRVLETRAKSTRKAPDNATCHSV